jgi:F-type H+-transporting ATPase subunit a
VVGILAAKEADFMIHSLQKLNIFGQEVYLTTTHASLLIIMVGLAIFGIFVKSKLQDTDKPNGIQNVAELAVEMLDSMVKSNMGKHAVKYRNYIGALFTFLLVSNISGILGLRPPTADYGVTFPLGLITFALIQYNNIKWNKFGAVTELFKPFPFLFPINLIGELAAPFSISLRLFGNVVSGTVIMALIYGLLSKIAFLWPGVLHAYFDIFSGAIQTYVFCMLTMVWITQKIPEDV